MTEVVFVPSSKLKREGGSAVVGADQNFELLKRAEKGNWRERAVEKTKDMEDLIRSVLGDLVSVYKDAEVDISVEGLAEDVFFVPATEENRAYFGENRLAAITQYGNVFVYVGEGGGLNLGVAVSLYHELHHRVGRMVTVGDQKNSSLLGQVGHFTQAIQKNAWGKVVRGMVLEEGIVDYFAVRYAIENGDKVIKKLRKREASRIFLRGVGDSVLLGEGRVGEVLMKLKTVHNHLDLIKYLHGENRYFLTFKLISQLLEDAVAVRGEQGSVELEKLLVASRVDSGKRRSLIEYVDSIYGSEFHVGRELFAAQFYSVENVRGILDKLVEIRKEW